MMNAAAVLFVGIGGAIALVLASRARARPRPSPATCSSWIVPSRVPADVAARAWEILGSGVELGEEFVEPWDGALYKFVVETHGPNDQNPRPHKGVGVRVCQRMEGAT